MMPEWILTILQAMLPGLIVSLIMLYWTREQNKKDLTQSERDGTAKKKDTLEIALLVATAELSYATTMAIKRGSPNGEVETAIERYNYAMEKFRKFEREQLSNVE